MKKLIVILVLLTTTMQAQDTLNASMLKMQLEIIDINLRLQQYTSSRTLAAVEFVAAFGLGLAYVASDGKNDGFLYASGALATISQVTLHFSAGTLKRKRK